ncbi:hypothetical protein Afe04nite_49100 [Asanoa ferruginea]|nr:hypothetical protein Afe04nite_49100 [Asanoa ferruginea]
MGPLWRIIGIDAGWGRPAQTREPQMSTMMDRYRSNRDRMRRARALERALSQTNSQSVRAEILAIAQRQQY